MGWVSLASGESGAAVAAAGGEARLVLAAALTFAAALLGVPLSARALARGRKFATIATSLAFVVCWSLKLASLQHAGGWWVAAARAAAGLGGAGAYVIPPLLATEMCERAVAGAAASSLVTAHNLGILLMYVAADQRIPHSTVLWSCLALSLAHCAVFLFVPESPAYLAASGKHEEARSSLAWLRGAQVSDPMLTEELAALPPPDHSSALQTLKELLSDRSRRRALLIGTITVVGQETCGIFTMVQFAERTFMLARDEHSEHVGALAAQAGSLASPARCALWLGVVQLLASVLSLYLVERVGRRPLIVYTAWLAAASLLAAAACARACPRAAAGALLAAVAADSAGLQPAPYALLADLFHYQFRSAALLAATSGTCAGNAAEVALLAAAARGGLRAALACAGALTALYAAFATLAAPETRGRTPDEIYKDMERSPLACFKNYRNAETLDTKFQASAGAMGLLDKLSLWLGRGRAEVTVLVLGLDNSGKSTLLRSLRAPAPAPPPPALPTVALHQETFQSGGVTFSAWDVSGAPRHRALWERHYRRAHAVVFVVDSADHLRLVVAREELELMLAHPDVSGRRLPLLVFANKCDAPLALSPMQIASALCLERISDKPWHICASNAVSGAGLEDGVAWLAGQIRDMHLHHK
ncbi:facilitated trehalose transporter Tret1 [Amyelois transitella]|uniref:facilitated trehalose transporter Tret1 n=1 Tax=Amyelois transitella TaxID=680683 RepID=UPI00298F5A0F|nr:facilitated trehalose transporter Tret1 [Amyelois transitella]